MNNSKKSDEILFFVYLGNEDIDEYLNITENILDKAFFLVLIYLVSLRYFYSRTELRHNRVSIC